MSHIFLQQRLSDPRFQSRRVDPFVTDAPWYASSRSAPQALTGVEPEIRKRHNFAKRKRTKDYSSDSSGTERETGDGHVENRIYRAKGESYDYYVYRPCSSFELKNVVLLDAQTYIYVLCVLYVQTRAKRSLSATRYVTQPTLLQSFSVLAKIELTPVSFCPRRACLTRTIMTRRVPTSTRVTAVRRRRTRARCALNTHITLHIPLLTNPHSCST